MNTNVSKTRPNETVTDVSHNLIVRLSGSSPEPTTLVEKLTIAILQRETIIPLHLLVQRVADELFHQELDDGAWVLDLVMFGSALFVRDVSSEIRARNGSLWQIEKQS